MEAENKAENKAKKKPRLTLKYVGSEPLPGEVHDVIKHIQKLMMDDHIKGRGSSNQQKTIPNMPRDFICSEVSPSDKVGMIKLAGKGYDNCLCYQISVQFYMNPYRMSGGDSGSRWFAWSGNVISFSQLSNNSELAVVGIKGNLLNIKDPSTRQRSLAYLSASTSDYMQQLTSKPSIKKFIESPLVVNHAEGDRLLSSYKMTISWLRSRLDKALNKYKKMQKNVEVIPTIKQKEGGPLLLHIKVEKPKVGSDEHNTHEFLFMLCPAFRVSSCFIAIPLVSYLGEDIPNEIESKNNEVKHCLWKIIPKCSTNDDTHVKHHAPNITTKINIELLVTSQGTPEIPKKSSAEDKAVYKESITKPKPITPAEQKHCEKCLNPTSRMLLEYYYQYGFISEDDMNEADSFVTEILNFFQNSLEEDRKTNDPKIVDFVKSGSVAEELKVVKPDEFDVMIHMDLPKSTMCYDFVQHDSFPTGFAICKVKRSHTFSRGLQRCFRKSEEFGHCLAPDKLAFGWLYGKLERAINKYKKEFPDGADLKLRQSGPALMLEIVPPNSHPNLPQVISVDLVLALKLSDSDNRYAVAKRAKEEQLYQKAMTRQQSLGPGAVQDGGEPNLAAREATITTDEVVSEEYVEEKPEPGSVSEMQMEGETDLAQKNLKFLWRISYSKQEKRYLEYVKEKQKEHDVEGCQNICLMILKTVCTREILKREHESVLYREVSSYILKTALFHVLARSDLLQDWKIDSLADRYMDLVKELSSWENLPHFFFNNASYLKEVFPDDTWCEESHGSKNLFDELHASLRLQLLERFSQIVQSFKTFKETVDMKYGLCVNDGESSSTTYSYNDFLQTMLEGKRAEEVIHPRFTKSHTKDRKSRKRLIDKQAADTQTRQAAKMARKAGASSSVDGNLRMSQQDAKRAQQPQHRNRNYMVYLGIQELLAQMHELGAFDSDDEYNFCELLE